MRIKVLKNLITMLNNIDDEDFDQNIYNPFDDYDPCGCIAHHAIKNNIIGLSDFNVETISKLLNITVNQSIFLFRTTTSIRHICIDYNKDLEFIEKYVPDSSAFSGAEQKQQAILRLQYLIDNPQEFK